MSSKQKRSSNGARGAGIESSPLASGKASNERSLSSFSGVPKHNNYQPFRDAEHQVRLLKLGAGTQGQYMFFETSIWDLTDAPPYVAISYTWASANTRSIQVDGHPMLVRFSAYYALWQVLQHWPDRYVWIDSISIDQNDEEEKSAQVAMMFQIYQGAWKVVISLGEHADDSEWLMAVINALEPLFRGLAAQYKLSWQDITHDHGEDVTLAPIWSHIFRALDEFECPSRILQAFQALAMRPYWDRLWIVQELAAARMDVCILLGQHDASVFATYTLLQALEESDSTRQMFQELNEHDASDRNRSLDHLLWILTNVDQDAASYNSLPSNIELFGEMCCADPRDRLFGTFGITNWEKSGCQPMLPDYSRSVWDLALMLAPLLDLAVIDDALRAFHIDGRHEDMTATMSQLKERLVPHAERGISQSVLRNANFQNVPRVLCACLLQSECESLTADLTPDVHYARSTRDAIRRLESADTVPAVKNARPLRVNEELAALLCPQAKAGDLIITVGYPWSGIVLVVRPQAGKSDVYDIIGQGILLNYYCISSNRAEFSATMACDCHSGSEPRHSVFEADVKLNLTAEEAVILVGQDHKLGMRMSNYDVDARLARATTPVTLAPKGAVMITNVRCYTGLESVSSEEDVSDSGSIQSDASSENQSEHRS